jgi:hypothetical protein
VVLAAVTNKCYVYLVWLAARAAVQAVNACRTNESVCGVTQQLVRCVLRGL